MKKLLMLLVVTIVLLAFNLVVGQAVGNFLNDDCDFYIIPSKFIGAGRAVVAGKGYQEGELIERAMCIEVPHHFIRKSQMNNYVFAGNHENTALMVLGISMLFNHLEDPNTDHLYAGFDYESANNSVPQPFRHFNVDIDAVDRPATRTISPGDEIFGSYGSNNSWFKSRDMDFEPSEYAVEKHRYSPLMLKANGFCYSNVYHEQSLISTAPAGAGETLPDVEEEFDYFGDFVQTRLDSRVKHYSTLCVPEASKNKLEEWDGGAGQGLFSKVMVKTGDLVTMSPLLVLPLHSIVAGSDANCTLINHCLASSSSLNRNDANYSDVCLLPFGKSALINHAPTRGRPSLCSHSTRNVTANVAMEWFAFNNYSAADACALSAAVLGADPRLYCDLPEGAKLFESNQNKSAQLDLLLSPETTLQQLEQYPYAPLDIGYRATRDIAPGDEIYVDYGAEWEVAFSMHLQRMTEYYEYVDRLPVQLEAEANGEGLHTNVMPIPPQFRHPMVLPEEMVPLHWKGVQCLGSHCSDNVD